MSCTCHVDAQPILEGHEDDCPERLTEAPHDLAHIDMAEKKFVCVCGEKFDQAWGHTEHALQGHVEKELDITLPDVPDPTWGDVEQGHIPPHRYENER